jgi:orotate phosphoribosyltransferase
MGRISSPKEDREDCFGSLCRKRWTRGFVIKRGYDEAIKGKNILVVEDILTTGGSAKRVVELVRSMGGNVVGLAALVNRGKVSSLDVGSPSKFFTLVNLKIESWTEEDCLFCKEGKPVNTELGKGKEYLQRKREES